MSVSHKNHHLDMARAAPPGQKGCKGCLTHVDECKFVITMFSKIKQETKLVSLQVKCITCYNKVVLTEKFRNSTQSRAEGKNWSKAQEKITQWEDTWKKPDDN
jgi:hypothetical protein